MPGGTMEAFASGRRTSSVASIFLWCGHDPRLQLSSGAPDAAAGAALDAIMIDELDRPGRREPVCRLGASAVPDYLPGFQAENAMPLVSGSRPHLEAGASPATSSPITTRWTIWPAWWRGSGALSLYAPEPRWGAKLYPGPIDPSRWRGQPVSLAAAAEDDAPFPAFRGGARSRRWWRSWSRAMRLSAQALRRWR